MKLSADWENIAELRRDLEAVADGLGRVLAEGITADAQPLLTETRALTPLGEGPRPTADPDSDDSLPHIRDTLDVQVRGGTLALISTHPGAIVHEFGGTIRPHGAAIQIQRSAMARRALVSQLPQIEESVGARIDQLLAQHS